MNPDVSKRYSDCCYRRIFNVIADEELVTQIDYVGIALETVVIRWVSKSKQTPSVRPDGSLPWLGYPLPFLVTFYGNIWLCNCSIRLKSWPTDQAWNIVVAFSCEKRVSNGICDEYSRYCVGSYNVIETLKNQIENFVWNFSKLNLQFNDVFRKFQFGNWFRHLVGNVAIVRHNCFPDHQRWYWRGQVLPLMDSLSPGCS